MCLFFPKISDLVMSTVYFYLLWSARIRIQWNDLLIYIKTLPQTVNSVLPGSLTSKKRFSEPWH